MNIKRNESLIVPIQVHALCVGEVESKQKGSFFSPPTASFISTMPSKKDGRKVPFISGPSIFKPFETDSGIEKGVHLHWFLPDALTHASVEPDEEGILQSVFPVVPNRWLVTRVCSMTDSQKGPQCSSKSWVVESDFLSTDIKYRKSANIPYADSDIPYRYMGRAVPLEQWTGDESNLRKTKQERYQGLTAIGYGDPCFSIYYPNCKNVFGFHDDLDDLLDTATEICNLSYSIIGWFSKSSDDPFSGLDSKSDSTVELEKCLKNFNWTVQSGSDLLNINKTICCGLLRDVKWTPKGEFITRKMDVSVGIGNTVSDGLSALIASEIQDGGEKTERLLETLQAGCLDQLDKVDAMADLTRRLHKNSFAVESAGILWSLQPKDPDQDIGYQDLGSNTALKLDELNRKQSQFNSEFYELDSRKSQTFLDWYKYMLFKYDQDTEEYLNEKNIDSEKFKSFIEQNTTDNTSLNELQLEIEQLRQSLIHDIGDDFLLKDIAAPRYFKPNDPVVLLAGEDLQPTLAYSPNDVLPCLLENQLITPDTFKKELQLSTNDLPLPESSHLPECTGRLLAELFFLDTAHMLLLTAMSSLDDDQATLDALRKKIEEKQKGLSAFYMVGNSSLSPATIAINTWSRPWNPLFMHWRIEYQPLEIIKNGQNEGDMPKSFPSDLVTSRFRLSEHTIDLSEKISSKENYEPYTGISILTPHAIRNFDELARAFSEQIDDLPQISSARRMLSKVPVLSQSLGGFHEALIMRQEEMQFPIDDPIAEGDEKSFHERIKKFVAQTNQHSPLPLNFFNPIRAGRMKIDTIRVVDTFGQYRNTSPRKLCIAKNLTPKENDGTHILLPPRLAQPSRLLVRWISAQKGLTETSEHPASTPICGWIVPNFLDQSLVIYDSEGRPVGVIRSRQRSETVFRSYPGITPEFSVTFQNQGGFDRSMEKFVPKNIFLRNFVTEMLKHDANHLMEFIKTLDRGLSFVEPEDAKDQDIKALLTGRPIALARLSVNLDIKGLPAANQSWSSLAYDIFNQSKGRDCADFTDIRFPIRLGTPQDKNEYNDGLIGYYKAGKDNLNYDCNTFYSWHADGSNEDIKKQSDSTLEITAKKKSPSLSLLVLMDPRAKLFVTSGILPKKGIEIPRFHFDNFWSSMGASFLTSPVLRHLDEGIDGINIPVSNETDYKWMWVSKEGDSWFERPVINGMAAHGSPIISEGWLKLVKK